MVSDWYRIETKKAGIAHHYRTVEVGKLEIQHCQSGNTYTDILRGVGHLGFEGGALKKNLEKKIYVKYFTEVENSKIRNHGCR